MPKPKLYSMTPWEMEELQSFIDKNLAKGFIQPTKSRMGAPVFRERKDGSLRLCIDYSGLNAICVENAYPLPLINNILGHLAKERFSTKLDLRGVYYRRVWIKKGDEWKMARWHSAVT